MRNEAQNTNLPERENKTGRWQGIDILKTICAFMVVIIHAPFPGEIGTYITALCRISVPIFFMITGFFYSTVVQRNREKHQIKKIFTLFLVTNVISLLAGCCTALASGTLRSFVCSLLEVQTLTEFWVWNQPPFRRHLWYLGAIFYTLIIVCFARKARAIRYLTYLIPVMMILSLILGKYCIVLFGTQIPYIYVRNYLLLGLPYFLLGHLLFEHRERIFERFTNRVFIICLVAFSVATVVERYFLVTNQVDASNDYYISTPFLACTVFLKFAKLCLPKTTVFTIALSQIGKRYSTWIYLLHPFLMGTADLITGEHLKFLRPVATFLLTLILCILAVKLFEILTHVKRQHDTGADTGSHK